MEETWTILRVLDWTRDWFTKKNLDNPRLDAEVLIAHALNMQRVMLYAHFDRPLAKEELAQIRQLVKRRGEREPVAYVTGRREFWSLEFEVNPSVLIPRPDTESLIELAVELRRDASPARVADVGTGSGCIAVALAKEWPECRIDAFDVSPEACAVARRNVDKHGLAERVRVFESDLLAAGDGVFDVICANLPYVSEREHETLAADVRDHEPRLALVADEDGLAIIRRLVSQAKPHLRPGGQLLLEAGAEQTPMIAELLTKAGYGDVITRKDYGGLARVASGRWPG